MKFSFLFFFFFALFCICFGQHRCSFLIIVSLNFPIDIKICVTWEIINTEKLVY